MGEKPEVVIGALIINNQGKILLCRSFKWNNLWIVPDGHIDYGETIEQAVKREVKEEVGLDVKLKEVMFVQELIEPKDFSRKKHFISLECVCLAENDDVKIDNEEIQEFKWFETKDALKTKTDPYTHEFIKKYLEER